jgi:hypothetical protein
VSRAYRVRISESLVRTIHVEDGVASPLEILPILPPERTAELVAAELVALGFVRGGATCRRTEPDGIEIVIDLAAATVAVKLAARREVEELVEVSVVVGEERRSMVEGALRDDAARQLDHKVEQRAEALRREVTAQLEARLGELRRELDGAIGRATISALTEKAAQLGHVEETHRDDAGNVTIRVRL